MQLKQKTYKAMVKDLVNAINNKLYLPPGISGGNNTKFLHKKFFLTKTVQERTWNPE